MTPLLLALYGFVLVVAVATVLARDPLVATVTFAPYSLGLAVVWVVFRAPDVAFTEAAVGAGVTTALLVATVGRTAVDRPEDAGTDGTTGVVRPAPRSVAVVAAFVLALLATVPSLPPVGARGPAFDGAAGYYLGRTAELGVDNVVTAVLVVYRGLDTFGEVAVVFAAALAALVAWRAVR